MLGFRAAVLGHLERGPEAKMALDRYLELRPNLKVRDDYRKIFVPNSAIILDLIIYKVFYFYTLWPEIKFTALVEMDL